MKQITILSMLGFFLFLSCKKDEMREPDTNYQPDVSAARFPNSTLMTNVYFPAAGVKNIRTREKLLMDMNWLRNKGCRRPGLSRV
ncbi:MAG: hypothetical protein IPL92_12815 [Saprospiraceae bacterium]|nr:hypothetical protein [Candidatus Opimibacter iunctus]